MTLLPWQDTCLKARGKLKEPEVQHDRVEDRAWDAHGARVLERHNSTKEHPDI